MRLILSFMVFALFGFAQQSCQKEETTTTNKTQETAKADTNSANANARTATRSGAPAAAQSADDDGAPRISLADAKKAFDAGEALFVDTRAESAFNVEHIKGAVNIPAEGFQKRAGEVPTGKKIIAYCS